jgi:bla regulator protein blaR1
MKALCLLAAAGCLFAQNAAAPLTFDVASIKPSAEIRGTFTRYLPGGGLQVSGATLKFLISMSYGVRDFQIVGAPAWADSDRFDIEARMDTPPGDESRNTTKRLATLLIDRFQLVYHRETREQPVYALVIAKGGPKFQESTETRGGIGSGNASITGHGVGIGLLALNLSNLLGRRVVDKTGLTAKYDFELKWAPDPAQPDAGAFGGPPDPNGPSLFTALPEQLGLRLESERGPVEMLLIDRAEKPSAN